MAKKDDTNKVAATEADTSTAVEVGYPSPYPRRDTPLDEPAGGWPADEFTGKGGSYIRDPLTGVRSPAPAVTEAAE